MFIPTVVETVTVMLGVQEGGACSEDCRVCGSRSEGGMHVIRGERARVHSVGVEGEPENCAARRCDRVKEGAAAARGKQGQQIL